MRPIALALLWLGLAAFPAAAQTTTEADGSRTLITEAWVPARPADVWPAVATAEGWKSWAVPAAWLTGDLLETSYDPAAGPGAAANIQQRILDRVPERLFVFRTVKTPEGFPHARAFMGVVQRLELIPEDGGTRVRLTSVNFPAGAEGDALLGFFRPGNQRTLDALAARFGRAPIDFLTGHCWRGTLPTGDLNIHCFERVGATVRDRHEVLRDGKKIYGGDTLYAWDGAARVLRFTYTGLDGGVMKGEVRRDGENLDFGTTDHVGTDGARIAIASRWIRVAPDAYEARDSSPTNARFNSVTRYTRVE